MVSGALLNGATRLPFEVFNFLQYYFLYFSSLFRSLNLYFFITHLRGSCLAYCIYWYLMSALNVEVKTSCEVANYYQQTRRQTPEHSNPLFMKILGADTV